MSLGSHREAEEVLLLSQRVRGECVEACTSTDSRDDVTTMQVLGVVCTSQLR